ncbi:DUF1963 domain-containing protein [Pseudomonas luteola]
MFDIFKIPHELSLFKDYIMGSLRSAAVLRESDTFIAPSFGYTHAFSTPDFPVDAEWADQYSKFSGCPYEGPAFWMQVNLSEIPEQARIAKDMPTQGMLWIYIDLSAEWKGIVHFDPRPAETILWRPRNPKLTYKPTEFSMTSVPPETIKEISSLGDEQLNDAYFNYASYGLPNGPYFGGYAWAIQSSEEDTQDSIVLTMNRLEIGDQGAFYLHYTRKKGWFVELESH